jgi:hypothetical protein
MQFAPGVRGVVNRHHFQLFCLKWAQRRGSGYGGWNCFFELQITASFV